MNFVTLIFFEYKHNIVHIKKAPNNVFLHYVQLLKKIFKLNFFISLVNFYYHSKKDWCRPYNALFNLIVLHCLPYYSDILINHILSKLLYIKALITSSCSILRSNSAHTTSKTCKEIIDKVAILVNKSRIFFDCCISLDWHCIFEVSQDYLFYT